MYFNIWLHYRQEERKDLRDYDSASTRYIHSIKSYSSELTFKALSLISSFRLITLFINSQWTNYPTHKHHTKLDQLKFHLILLKERTNGNGKMGKLFYTGMYHHAKISPGQKRSVSQQWVPTVSINERWSDGPKFQQEKNAARWLETRLRSFDHGFSPVWNRRVTTNGRVASSCYPFGNACLCRNMYRIPPDVMMRFALL